MICPKYAKVGNKEYKINTDFRVAIECNRIAEDTSIGNYERALAIIYTLFGDDGLNNPKDYERLLELAQKYLLCGKKFEKTNEEPDMDFIQDMDYIEASFMSDYNIDLSNVEMDWWRFNNLMNGLSNSELGNCCVLNRIRNLRNVDESKIDDPKERKKIIQAKKQVALHKTQRIATGKQRQSAIELYKMLGLGKE